ncbi:MAG: hypothetical protein EP330_28255 [Deltaproteobacteria bacterium]|nr:MAG: hypothetical protein EP330_28255 [Deltaproteobacteria bacterium]
MFKTLASPTVLFAALTVAGPLAAALFPSTAYAGGATLVTVGSSDMCDDKGRPCDANFSISAREDDEGLVFGTYIDRFENGEGFVAEVDCVFIDGDDAWISGVILDGTWDGQDKTGETVITRVRDNGAGRGETDQISYSYIGYDLECTDAPNLRLFPVPRGQVRVH